MLGRVTSFSLLLLSLPALADDSRGGRIPPPIPSGPPLELPSGVSSTKPTWLEDDGDVRRMGANDDPPMFLQDDKPRHPTPPPATFAGSACNFDALYSNDVFSPDYGNFQVLFGAYFSGQPGPKIPTYNYTPFSIRAGWMLTSPDNTGILFGNWEFLTDLTVAPITSHYGHVFGGPTFYLRKNFVSPGATIVPYCQLGVGCILNDAHQDMTQAAIGEEFEFYLHGEVGLKCFLTHDLSLDIEMGLQHTSNANLASRNLGANCFGGSVGFTYYFPWQDK
jgi:lipid A 3-O-deacylase